MSKDPREHTTTELVCAISVYAFAANMILADADMLEAPEAERVACVQEFIQRDAAMAAQDAAMHALMVELDRRVPK